MAIPWESDTERADFYVSECEKLRCWAEGIYSNVVDIHCEECTTNECDKCDVQKRLLNPLLEMIGE